MNLKGTKLKYGNCILKIDCKFRWKIKMSLIPSNYKTSSFLSPSYAMCSSKYRDPIVD